MAKTKTNGEQVAGIGHNGLPEKGKDFVQRVETVEVDIDKSTETFRDEVLAPLKADVKAIYDEAKAAGLTKKSIKAVVTARKKERQAAAARDKLDIADRDTFDNIRLALKDIADLPLAAAAIEAAARTSA